MHKTNENKPVSVSGYLVNHKKETFKSNGVDVDVIKLILAFKTKDSKDRIRDQFVEVRAANGAYEKWKELIDFAISVHDEGKFSAKISLEAFLGGYSYKAEEKVGKKTIEVTRYVNTLFLAQYGLVEVGMSTRYEFEEETKTQELPESKSSDEKTLAEFLKK